MAASRIRRRRVIPMSLVGVRVEVPSNQPIVLLREDEGQRYLPIFIGQPEATAIVYALQGTETPRPMTHDLFKTVLDDLGTKVLQVVITELHDGTFYAEIEFAPRRRHLPHLVPPLRRHRPGRPLRRAGADLRPRGGARGGRRALRAGRGRRRSRSSSSGSSSTRCAPRLRRRRAAPEALDLARVRGVASHTRNYDRCTSD